MQQNIININEKLFALIKNVSLFSRSYFFYVWGLLKYKFRNLS